MHGLLKRLCSGLRGQSNHTPQVHTKPISQQTARTTESGLSGFMTAAHDERANMSSTAIVKSHAQAIAESVDWEAVGIDPITIITWVQMISKLLEFVLPTLAECLHMNDDATPSTAQQRVATLQSRNSERLLRRTKLNIAKQNRRSARKDSSIQLLDDAQATVLAKAIIGHTLRDNECGAVFAACLQQVA